ncbi:hypothetical protein GZH47_32660 (plasmid) [Paenibacillus rhizovicinus]|uniref:Uncharacterized protein n=1 Tax=Paenibacillus rhizovicinus TaxID=2704463 RepID=A0A6C0PCX8_9BACL|nr:hypothetical protein [Paenibacillus rhizovicinus]QHW35652.1 hypothetical protein GZH47_32660 [Paenibacillus rhizovicinus]
MADSWMDTLNSIMFPQETNLNTLAEESTMASSEDVGFVNPLSGAGLLARSSGVLEGFSDYGLGFRMDPESKTFSIYAARVNLFCSQFKVFSGDHEFTIIDTEQEEILGLIGGKADEEV